MKLCTTREFMGTDISFERKNKKIISLQKSNFIQLIYEY